MVFLHVLFLFIQNFEVIISIESHWKRIYVYPNESMSYFTLYYSLNIVKIAYIVSMVTEKQNIVLHNFFT